MGKKKSSYVLGISLWVLAVALTAGVAIYQRMTGPTHPIRGKERVGEATVSYRFLRSQILGRKLNVQIFGAAKESRGTLLFRRYPSKRPFQRQALVWSSVRKTRHGKPYGKAHQALVASLAPLPMAGKWEYTVELVSQGKKVILNRGKTAVARYRGDVPAGWLIAHIVMMFLALIFGFRTMLEALRKEGNYRWMVYTTLVITFVGGLILGPVVQKYAFDAFWTGLPFGTDLTDNKTLIAVLCWGAAALAIWRQKSRWWVVAAALLMFIIYLIPHSVLGSELDPETGRMKNTFSGKK